MSPTRHPKSHLASALLAATLATSLFAQTQPADSANSTWSAKDTAGNPVSVPADRTTVLAFLRPGQAQSTQLIEQLRTAAKDAKNIQVIAIVSGEDANVAAAALAKPEAKWKSPVVVDTEYSASGKFNVHAWPTTVVITKAGKETAHIAGLPASFAADLDAYLDFASGKIDQPALGKRLAHQTVIADSAEQKATRHIQVAQRLAEKGLKDQAKAELAKAADFKPADPATQATLTRMFLSVGDTASAQSLLAKIKDDAIAPSELNFLRGWTSYQLQKWDDALKSLTEAVKLNPQPAEACYLLGLVYQHNGDYAKAADSFRKAFEHTPLGREISTTP